jgi:hypothetical protein
VTTEHEFKTTYRGVDVPAWIADTSGDHQGYNGEGGREAFTNGVDAVLGAQAEKGNHQETTPALREWIDRDGALISEVEPGVVVYASGRANITFPLLSLDSVERRFGPLTLLTD